MLVFDVHQPPKGPWDSVYYSLKSGWFFKDTARLYFWPLFTTRSEDGQGMISSLASDHKTNGTGKLNWVTRIFRMPSKLDGIDAVCTVQRFIRSSWVK